jgi:hypothetical protein
VPAFAAAAAALLIAGSAVPAQAQWQIESKDGKTNIKVGFLAQPQFESLQTTDPASTTGGTVNAKNLFIRRFRIVFGGQLAGNWTFFFETDSPNVGKQVAGTSAKDSGSIFIQDAFVTYNHGDEFKVDAGLILLGLDHNHLQSAATLLPVDYSPYTFNESAPLQERVGRDYGLEARGYPLKQHLEYRLGVFQGLRGAESRNGFRVAGRAVWYPFAADTGFFYAGTFQGTKRVVGIGASFDTQNAPEPVAPLASRTRYSSYGADAFVEQPIRGGEEGVTAQFDWLRFDGGTLLATLARQNTYLAEGAFHFGKGHYSPFVQYAKRDFLDAPTVADTSYWQAGFAWWMAGHQRNLKLSAGRFHTDAVGTLASTDRTQVLLQLQIFYF